MASIFRAAQIPNAICVLRIVLIWPICQLLVDGHYLSALLLIAIAGLSDGLDGFLAKTFHWQSRIGGLLDPLADKLLLTSLFIALSFAGLSPVWLAAVVVGRDIVIVFGAVAFELLVGNVQPRPTRVSKLNTALEILYVLFVIAGQAFGWPPVISVTVLGAAVLVSALVSGIDYVLCWSRFALQAWAR